MAKKQAYLQKRSIQSKNKFKDLQLTANLSITCF